MYSPIEIRTGPEGWNCFGNSNIESPECSQFTVASTENSVTAAIRRRAVCQAVAPVRRTNP